MLYCNFQSEHTLFHSSTRESLKVKALRSIHADRVLVLAPHPDDDVFGCGGLLAHLIEHKAKVKVLYFCGGALGNSEGDRDLELVAQREIEAVNGLHELGGGEVNFFRCDDNKLDQKKWLWEKIYEEMLVFKPDLVLLPDNNDWHPDHEAVYAASILAYRKLHRHKPKMWTYFVWGLNRPSYLMPLDKKLENIKSAAMACHKSQLKVKPYNEAILASNQYLGLGLGLGLPAEGFRELKL